MIGYRDGRAIWEDLGPADNVSWGHALGGRQIEERGPMTKQELQLRYKAAKRLRGSLLAPGEKA